MLRDLANRREAVKYIRDCLKQGNTLAQRLLQLPLEEGNVVVPLPATVHEEAYAKFEVGGVTSRDKTEALLADFISAYLHGANGRYVIFEDELAQPGDAFLSSSKAQFVTFGPEVYYFLSSQDSDANGIIATIQRATSYLFIGVLTSLGTDTDLSSGQAMAADWLSTVVRHTEALLIGAYDGEGVLIWSYRWPLESAEGRKGTGGRIWTGSRNLLRRADRLDP
jgi:hypothetical protein